MDISNWIDLSGKVAHVTGAGRGIGAAIAEALAAAGAKVVLSDVDISGITDLAAKIDGIAMPLDVSNRSAVDQALADTVKKAGSLDILVNNAGVYVGYGGPVRTITDDMWRTLWSINVDGVFYTCRTAASLMIEAGRGGRIINIASTQAVTPGFPQAARRDDSKIVVAAQGLRFQNRRDGARNKFSPAS